MDFDIEARHSNSAEQHWNQDYPMLFDHSLFRPGDWLMTSKFKDQMKVSLTIVLEHRTQPSRILYNNHDVHKRHHSCPCSLPLQRQLSRIRTKWQPHRRYQNSDKHLHTDETRVDNDFSMHYSITGHIHRTEGHAHFNHCVYAMAPV